MQTKGPPASEQVNLRLGYPSPLQLPVEGLRKAMAAKMAEDDPEFFMYGVPEGFFEFRDSLATFLTEVRTATNSDGGFIGSFRGAAYWLSVVEKPR